MGLTSRTSWKFFVPQSCLEFSKIFSSWAGSEFSNKMKNMLRSSTTMNEKYFRHIHLILYLISTIDYSLFSSDWIGKKNIMKLRCIILSGSNWRDMNEWRWGHITWEKHLLCVIRQKEFGTLKESIFARIIFLLGVCMCTHGLPFLTLNASAQDVLEYNIHHPNLLNELSSYFMVDSSFIQITPLLSPLYT